MLNTDWTTAGNSKRVTVDGDGIRFETCVVEREPKILTVLDDVVIEPDDPALHLEVTGNGTALRCHGTGNHTLALHRRDGATETRNIDFGSSTVSEIVL